MADGETEATWARLEAALGIGNADAAEGVLSIARAELHRLHAKDSGIEGRTFPIDARRVAVFASYRCGGHSDGGVLLLVVKSGPSRWGVRDRVLFPAGSLPDVIAAERESFVVAASALRTQDRESRLYLVRADGAAWSPMFDRAHLLDLETTVHDHEVVARWSELSEVFATSVDGPRPVYEVTLSLERAEQVGAMRSRTPWLTALEDACRRDADDPRIPCAASASITDARVVGRYVAVTFQGSATPGACKGEAIGSYIVEDSAVVVELAHADDEWRIIGQRPSDRGCAATAAGVATAFTADADANYWTNGDDVLVGRGSSRPRRAARLRDSARLIAHEGGTFYWISAETGRVRRLAGTEPETLDEDALDAAGLVVHGDSVYWSVYGRGQIRRYRAGRVEVFASGLDMPMGLAVREEVLLVATATGIMAIDPRTGVKTPTSFEALAPIGLAATQEVVAWSEAGGRILASTGPSTRLIAEGARPVQLNARDGAVVWLDPKTGRVRHASLD